MSKRDEAYRDAINWFEDYRELKPIQQATIRHFFDEAFTKGKQLTIEELAAKSAEGFDDFLASKLRETKSESQGRDILANVEDYAIYWQAGRTPLLAKISELEPSLATYKRKVNDLTLAIKISSDANFKTITNLEAQNKKLGDVVLEMAELTRASIDRLEFYGMNTDLHESVLDSSADLIKQLKQERV